jgi:lipoprotein-releasing system permease protein
VGVITSISIVGVAAGVASLIVALAINNGFRQDLQARLLGSMAHVQLMRTAGDGIQHWPLLLQQLNRLPHVAADAPAIYEQVLISRGARAKGAVLKGMVPSYERQVSQMLQTLTAGSASSLEPLDKSDAPRSEAASPGAQDQLAGADSLAAVQERLQQMPPIVLGKDLADELGAAA